MDPSDDPYLEEAAVRHELTRVFDLCGSCRRCIEYCDSFPILFDALDRLGPRSSAGDLTPHEQDRIVDGCVHCGACAIGCPFGPDVDVAPSVMVDYPEIMARATAMRRAAGQMVAGDRRAAWFLTRSGRFRFGIIRWALGHRPGSVIRRIMAAVAGVSSRRRVPGGGPTLREAEAVRRGRTVIGRDRIVLATTCAIDRSAPDLLGSIIGVYAEHGIACDVVDIGCCGAPARAAGDRAAVGESARSVTDILRPYVDTGIPIVITESACARMMRERYRHHLPDDDLAVTAGVVDLVSDLAVRAEDHRSTGATGAAPPQTVRSAIVIESLSAPTPSPTTRLMTALGVTAVEVRGTTGVESIWGWRSSNDDLVDRRSALLAGAVSDALSAGLPATDRPDRSDIHPVIVTESATAGLALAETLGTEVVHPVVIMARRDFRES